MNTAEGSRARVPAWAMLLLVMFLWGSAFPGIRAGLEGYPPGGMALLRFLVASAVIAALFLRRPLPLPRGADWLWLSLSGFLSIFLYNVAINIGEQTISAGAASFIVSLTPVLTAVLAPLVLKERPARRSWFSLGLGFVGVSLIALGEGDAFRFEAGVAWVFICALTGAVNILIQKPLLARYDGLTVAGWAIWFGSAMLLVFSAELLAALPVAPASATIAVIYLGIFPGAVAFVLWTKALATIPATRAARSQFLIPAMALSISWLWLREVPSGLAIVGGSLTLVGVAWGYRPGQSPGK
jgi:drug/metabolite transporter (DMT)-like permease